MALYDAALHLLLERRDSERDVPAAKQVRLDARSKISILQHIAWRLTLAGQAELTVEMATGHVNRALSRLPGVHAEPESVVAFLVERSGVIRMPIENRIDFVHRTFQEYLAAKEAADDHLVETLVSRAHSDQWRETIVMAAGHATPRHREALLGGILDRAEREPRYARRLRLLAAACLETAHSVEPAVAAQISEAIDSLMPPSGQRETRSLALAGVSALRKLPTSLNDLTEAVAAACVRTAALINGREAISLLAGYASDPRNRVQEELARVWTYFDPEEYVKTVLADAPLNSGRIVITRIDHIRFTPHLRHLENLSVTLTDDVPDNLTFLDPARNLTDLWIQSVGPVDLSPLETHGKLTAVTVLSAGAAEGFHVLAQLPLLKSLRMALGGIESIDFVTSLANLESLYLSNLETVKDVSPISELTDLKRLGIDGYKREVATVLMTLSDLIDLSLFEVLIPAGIGEIEPLLPKLEALFLTKIEGIRSISQLRIATGLRRLRLWGCPVSDISVLAFLVNLQYVDLDGTMINDLSPLSGLPRLNSIDLRHCSSGLDLTPLSNLRLRSTIWLDRERKPEVGALIRARHRVRWQ
jgi:Leucine-rich repeat (LRR) protein